MNKVNSKILIQKQFKLSKTPFLKKGVLHMNEYLDVVKTVLEKGQLKHNRTGIDTLSYFGAYYKSYL